MKDIYLLSLCMDAGGVEKSICLLANSLSKRGYHIIIINVLKSNPIIELEKNIVVKTLTSFKRDGIVKRNIFYRVLRKIISKLFLIHAIKSIEDSIIISTRNEYSIMVSRYSANSNINIAQLHHDHCFNSKLLDDFKYRYTNIDFFVHLSELAKNEIESYMSTNNSKTKNIVIENFVPYHEYKEIKKHNYVISVGRFSPEKGFLRLIDVWAKVLEKNSNYQLLLIGDGPEKDNIQERIKKYGIENNIILPGFLDNKKVMEYMSVSKIYAMPSVSEAFGFVLVEAMQNKLPLISFDVRLGPKELVKNGENGFLVCDGDIADFAEKLLLLMEDNDLCNRLGATSLQLAYRYTEDVIIDKWIQLLSKL